MPIPIYKLAILGVKVLTQPLLTQTKRFFLRSEHGKSNKFIIMIGNKVHLYETKINRRFLEEENQDAPVTPISDEIAVEKAFSFILEVVILYGILGYIAIKELMKGGKSKEKLQEEIEELDKNQKGLQQAIIEINSQMRDFTAIIKEQKELIISYADSNKKNDSQVTEQLSQEIKNLKIRLKSLESKTNDFS